MSSYGKRTLGPTAFFDGEATAFDLRGLNAPFVMLLFGGVRVTEENLTLSCVTIPDRPKEDTPLAAYRGIGPLTFTVRHGCAMEVLAGTLSLTANRQLMIFVMPTETGLAIVKDMDKFKLPPLF